MATNTETMWVSDQAQLEATVQTLVSQGGVVQGQYDIETQVFLKKKLNIVVLIVGLVLCVVPGVAYLIWYSTADQNQQITVKIGSPASIRTEHQHWYDDGSSDGDGAPGQSGPGATAPDSSPPSNSSPAPDSSPSSTTD